MKYLLIGENDKNAQELLDRIAAFLWDNGNVIYIYAVIFKRRLVTGIWCNVANVSLSIT
ncbi:hypothetical protein [Pedobacter kyonggii]|uniref:hypothetical protein n=1 Tax=Pedobacter kyonggii TaxID=1926871 RepID=UPI0013EEEA87|nr:hypothetical protein [Pedobacter kyonggii]